jgi:hypothetical protein
VTGVVAVVVEGGETATDRQAFQVRSRPFREAGLTVIATESELLRQSLKFDSGGSASGHTVLFISRISLPRLEVSDPVARLMVKASGM